MVAALIHWIISASIRLQLPSSWHSGALKLPPLLFLAAAADAASLKDVFSAFAGFGIHTPTPTKAAEPVFHTNTATPTTVRRVSTPGSAAGGKAAGPGMDGFRCGLQMFCICCESVTALYTAVCQTFHCFGSWV
jgi:hypothetical protein